MICRRKTQIQLSFPELISLVSISVVITCAIKLISGQINHDSFVGSNSIVILPQRDYSETSIQKVNESSLANRKRHGSAHEDVEREPRPVFSVAFADAPDDGKALGLNINPMNEGYLILPREIKNTFNNSTSLYDLLSKVSNRAVYQMSNSPQYEHTAVIGADQWIHSATTTARPTYDQIPRPMLHVHGEDDR